MATSLAIIGQKGDGGSVVEMSVAGLALDASSRSPIVLLRDPSGRRQVPIWIDQAQAHNIMAGIQDSPIPRPLTHDLMVALLKAGNLQLENNVSSIAYTFYIAAGASIILGLFSFSLPNVPPKGKTDGSTFGLEGLILLKDKSYLIFFISAVLICIPLSFYYSFANVFLNDLGMEGAAGKMIYGQISEAIFILAIPFLYL